LCTCKNVSLRSVYYALAASTGKESVMSRSGVRPSVCHVGMLTVKHRGGGRAACDAASLRFGQTIRRNVDRHTSLRRAFLRSNFFILPAFLRPSVCLSALPHNTSKTDAARTTKLDVLKCSKVSPGNPFTLGLKDQRSRSVPLYYTVIVLLLILFVMLRF